MNTIAMTSAQGTLLTIAIIVVIVLLAGVIVISDDMNWFD
jgi:hypothetical protein